MKLTIIIKALNEERNIVRCIESSVEAVRDLEGGGEVILADSLSTDGTIELASRYPIKIVQLSDAADRSCGVGAEIGFRIASGEFVYILDADMEIDSSFLREAIRLLEEDASVGGVGGMVEEMHVLNAEFRGRVAQGAGHMRPGDVDRLNMGGLYRRADVVRLGYLTNRNLHSFEEYELGVRLRAAGLRLVRLNQRSVRHYGHTDASFVLLIRRWRSMYLCGLGELVRATFGTPYFYTALREVRLYRQTLAVLAWWCALLGLCLAGAYSDFFMVMFFFVAVLPVAMMWVRRRSISDAVYVVAFLNLYAFGLIRGLLREGRGEPNHQISCQILR